MWLHFISHYLANLRLFKHTKTKITIADINDGGRCLDHPINFMSWTRTLQYKVQNLYMKLIFFLPVTISACDKHIMESDCGGMISCGYLKFKKKWGVVHTLTTVL